VKPASLARQHDEQERKSHRGSMMLNAIELVARLKLNRFEVDTGAVSPTNLSC
jgi:hypothetical protein